MRKRGVKEKERVDREGMKRRRKRTRRERRREE